MLPLQGTDMVSDLILLVSHRSCGISMKGAQVLGSTSGGWREATSFPSSLEAQSWDICDIIPGPLQPCPLVADRALFIPSDLVVYFRHSLTRCSGSIGLALNNWILLYEFLL